MTMTTLIPATTTITHMAKADAAAGKPKRPPPPKPRAAKRNLRRPKNPVAAAIPIAGARSEVARSGCGVRPLTRVRAVKPIYPV